MMCEDDSCKSCHSWHQIDNYFGNTMDSMLTSKGTFRHGTELLYEVLIGLKMFMLCEKQIVGSFGEFS